MISSELADRVYNLRFIQRYSLTPRATSETVAEHSFYVGVFVVQLAEVYKFDLGKALLMATIHDFAESELGDITLTSKQLHPELVEVVKVSERRIMDTFSPLISEAYKEYEERLTVESKIVKLADVLQVKQYCMNELEISNNAFFHRIFAETQLIIDRLETELITSLK